MDAMIDRIAGSLQGYTEDQETLTVLTDGAASDVYELQVHDASQITTGLAELGDELVWVHRSDPETNLVTVMPQGRGWQGSAAADHPVGTILRNNPRFPRLRIRQAIASTLGAVSDTLFAVKDVRIAHQPARLAYQLPSDCRSVLSVKWESIGPSQSWVPVRNWLFDTDGDIGPCLQVNDWVVPGRTMQVVYAADPQPWSDGFSESGLPESCEDVILLGACAHLVGFLEPGRIANQSVEADMLSQTAMPAGASTNAARYFLSLYARRLDEERAKLLSAHPARIHRTR